MSVSKSKREAVYRKYDGHCAYCGREIAYKDRLQQLQRSKMSCVWNG